MKRWYLYIVVFIACVWGLMGCANESNDKETVSEKKETLETKENSPNIEETQTSIINNVEKELETTHIKVDNYDIAPDDAKSIELIELVRQQNSIVDKEINYVYTNDIYNIAIKHYDTELGKKRELVFNGKTMQIIAEQSYDGTYYLCLNDVNKDGYRDIIVYNMSYNEVFINTFLYDGSNYKCIGDISVNNLEISAKLLNGSKISVECKVPEFHGTFMMADLYVKYLEAWGVYGDGRLLNSLYEINGEMEKVKYGFFEKNGEVIIALNMHYTDKLKSTGIVAVAYYAVREAEYEMVNVEFINSNMTSR